MPAFRRIFKAQGPQKRLNDERSNGLVSRKTATNPVVGSSYQSMSSALKAPRPTPTSRHINPLESAQSVALVAAPTLSHQHKPANPALRLPLMPTPDPMTNRQANPAADDVNRHEFKGIETPRLVPPNVAQRKDLTTAPKMQPIAAPAYNAEETVQSVAAPRLAPQPSHAHKLHDLFEHVPEMAPVVGEAKLLANSMKAMLGPQPHKGFTESQTATKTNMPAGINGVEAEMEQLTRSLRFGAASAA